MSREPRGVALSGPVRSLGSVRRDFTRWRGDPARPRRIPEALWQAAAELAAEHGVARVARELGLDYYSLDKRLGSRSSGVSRTSSTGAFVELSLPAQAAASAPEHSVEVADDRGVRLRVELRGAARAEVEALAQALWRATR